jgi:hypothetical protein
LQGAAHAEGHVGFVCRFGSTGYLQAGVCIGRFHSSYIGILFLCIFLFLTAAGGEQTECRDQGYRSILFFHLDSQLEKSFFLTRLVPSGGFSSAEARPLARAKLQHFYSINKKTRKVFIFCKRNAPHGGRHAVRFF